MFWHQHSSFKLHSISLSSDKKRSRECFDINIRHSNCIVSAYHLHFQTWNFEFTYSRINSYIYMSRHAIIKIKKHNIPFNVQVNHESKRTILWIQTRSFKWRKTAATKRLLIAKKQLRVFKIYRGFTLISKTTKQKWIPRGSSCQLSGFILPSNESGLETGYSPAQCHYPICQGHDYQWLIPGLAGILRTSNLHPCWSISWPFEVLKGFQSVSMPCWNVEVNAASKSTYVFILDLSDRST